MLHPEKSSHLSVGIHLKVVMLWLIILAVSLTSASCGSTTDAVPELSLQGQWHELFADTVVTVLVPDDNGLLVGTEQGLFKWKAEEVINLGLNDRKIPGVVRLKGNGLLAGAMLSSISFEDTTLFRSQNEGASWEPFLNNFGGEVNTRIGIGPFAVRPFPDTLFVQGTPHNIIARSTDGGQSWELVLGHWDNSGGSGALFYIDPWHPGRIWAGGVTSLSQPSLWKSTDYGDNWEWLGESIREVEGVIFEAVAYDVMTHPEDSGQVLVGFSINARKSTDGGESWQVVLDSTGVFTFARSIRNPEVIYASGRDASTRLFFAATTDFGETWEKEIFEEGPSVVTTNDLTVMKIDGKEVLFLGTDHGLFSYTFEE